MNPNVGYLFILVLPACAVIAYIIGKLIQGKRKKKFGGNIQPNIGVPPTLHTRGKR